MKTVWAQRVLELMTKKAPRQAAEALLEYLSMDSDASGAALFTVDESACTLFLGAPINQEGVDWCFEVWTKSQVQLKAGFSVQHEHRRLFPLMLGGSCVGLLHIEATHFEEVHLLEVAADLASSLVRCQTRTSAIEDYLQNTPSNEIDRKRLELLLSRHEWNISRVARILGYARITVYRHMERFGIPRLKTGKGEA
jgi:hypothetical protein